MHPRCIVLLRHSAEHNENPIFSHSYLRAIKSHLYTSAIVSTIHCSRSPAASNPKPLHLRALFLHPRCIVHLAHSSVTQSHFPQVHHALSSVTQSHFPQVHHALSSVTQSHFPQVHYAPAASHKSTSHKCPSRSQQHNIFLKIINCQHQLCSQQHRPLRPRQSQFNQLHCQPQLRSQQQAPSNKNAHAHGSVHSNNPTNSHCAHSALTHTVTPASIQLIQQRIYIVPQRTDAYGHTSVHSINSTTNLHCATAH